MGKPCMLAAVALAVGAGVAMKRRAALPSTGACALLEQLVMTQRSVDAHIQMPKDFAYVPFEMVEACGSASFRMPYPYKIHLPSHRPVDQLYADFKALDKATVLTREIGEGPDDSDDYLRNSKFAKHSGSQEEKLGEGVESLSNGTKALFFDNSWTYDHFRPMLNEPERFDKIFENCLFGNMFTTNLTEQRFTAKAHSAPWYGSVAVQLAGVKRWKFWDPATFGAHGVPSDESSFENMAVSRILPSRGMTKLMKTIDHYDVVSSAGDVVYFPAFWTHVVYTDPGFNLMINLRARHHPSMALGWLRNALQIHSVIGMLKMVAIFTLVSGRPPGGGRAREARQGARRRRQRDGEDADMARRGRALDERGLEVRPTPRQRRRDPLLQDVLGARARGEPQTGACAVRRRRTRFP